jgi:putative addiction module component (TIGR02574 family)
VYNFGMNDSPKLKDILGLPVEDRLAIASAICDSLAAEPGAVPVPAWHREIVEQRLADDEADPSAIEFQSRQELKM